MQWDQWTAWLPIAAAVFGVIVVLLLSLRHSDDAHEDLAPDNSLEIGSLTRALPETGPSLEVYGVPVRLAAVIVAPSGRGETLNEAQAMEIVGQLAPRMDEVAISHEPRWLCWPSQLSTRGFRTMFVNRVPLPGDRGRGTCWCTATGKLTLGDRQWLLGLVFVSATPSPLSDIELEHEGRWPDVLRVRAEST